MFRFEHCPGWSMCPFGSRQRRMGSGVRAPSYGKDQGDPCFAHMRRAGRRVVPHSRGNKEDVGRPTALFVSEPSRSVCPRESRLWTHTLSCLSSWLMHRLPRVREAVAVPSVRIVRTCGWSRSGVFGAGATGSQRGSSQGDLGWPPTMVKERSKREVAQCSTLPLGASGRRGRRHSAWLSPWAHQVEEGGGTVLGSPPGRTRSKREAARCLALPLGAQEVPLSYPQVIRNAELPRLG